jgi:hypothetical protein
MLLNDNWFLYLHTIHIHNMIDHSLTRFGTASELLEAVANAPVPCIGHHQLVPR